MNKNNTKLIRETGAPVSGLPSKMRQIENFLEINI